MKKHWLLHTLAGLAISGLALWNHIDRATGAAVRNDAMQYLIMGYNIARHHIFSLDTKAPANGASLTPYIERTPGFPAFLATCLTLHPQLRNVSLAQLTTDGVDRLSLAYDITHLANSGDSLMLEAWVRLSGSGTGALFVNTQPPESEKTCHWEDGLSEKKFAGGNHNWFFVSLKMTTALNSAKILAGITFRPAAPGTCLQIKQFRVTRQSDNAVLIDDDFTVWNGPETVKDEQINSIGSKLNVMAEKQGDFLLTHGMDDSTPYYEIKFIRPGQTTPPLATLKSMQTFVLLATAWLAFVIVLKLTKRIGLSYLALCLILFSTTMQNQMNTLLTELFTAAILLALSWLLYLIAKQPRFWLWIVFGLAVAVLTFAQAVMLYFPCIIVILALLFLARQPKGTRLKHLAGVASFALICAVLLGGWMTRNKILRGQFVFSGRGAYVLYMRSCYNTMSRAEYLAAFPFWTPDSQINNRLLNALYGEQTESLTCPLKLVGPKTYRCMFDQEWQELQSGKSYTEAEALLQPIAIRRILAHPLRHLAVALPLAWRGMFAEEGFRIHLPVTLLLHSPVLINLAYMLAWLCFMIWSLWRRQWPLLAFCLPALYLFGFYAMFSHHLTRYTYPIIPFLVVILMLTVDRLLSLRHRVKPQNLCLKN